MYLVLREQDSNLRSYVIVTECLPHSPFVLCYIKHNIFLWYLSKVVGWARRGLNPWPSDYESAALTSWATSPYIYSTPYWIWTNDFKFRKLALYPAELREHFLFHDAKILKIFGITKLFNNFFHCSIFNVVPFVFSTLQRYGKYFIIPNLLQYFFQ